jgi:hypothetical protein
MSIEKFQCFRMLSWCSFSNDFFSGLFGAEGREENLTSVLEVTCCNDICAYFSLP